MLSRFHLLSVAKPFLCSCFSVRFFCSFLLGGYPLSLPFEFPTTFPDGLGYFSHPVPRDIFSLFFGFFSLFMPNIPGASRFKSHGPPPTFSIHVSSGGRGNSFPLLTLVPPVFLQGRNLVLGNLLGLFSPRLPLLLYSPPWCDILFSKRTCFPPLSNCFMFFFRFQVFFCLTPHPPKMGAGTLSPSYSTSDIFQFVRWLLLFPSQNPASANPSVFWDLWATCFCFPFWVPMAHWPSSSFRFAGVFSQNVFLFTSARLVSSSAGPASSFNVWNNHLVTLAFVLWMGCPICNFLLSGSVGLAMQVFPS